MKHPNEEIMRKLVEYTKIKTNPNQRFSSGCFIVKDDKIISKGIWDEKQKNPIGHGEINAINNLCKKREDQLRGSWIYSTQIPCPMCTSAIVWSEAEGIVWGCDGRYAWERLDIHPEEVLKTSKNKIKLHGPFLEKECLKFFDKENK